MSAPGIATQNRRAHRWTPALLGAAGVAFWIDASQESFANNDAVGTATDRSGNGRNATQGTAGAKPTFKTGVLNGSTMSAYSFDGGDALQTSSFSLTNSGILFVCKITTHGMFAETGNDANSVGTFYLYDTVYTYFRRGVAGAGADAGASWLGSSEAIGGGYYDGTNQIVRKNGATAATQSGSSSVTDTQALNIFARANGLGGLFVTGLLGEMILLVSPTADLIVRTEGYLAWKWGLQGTLDSAHQWKYARPNR